MPVESLVAVVLAVDNGWIVLDATQPPHTHTTLHNITHVLQTNNTTQERNNVRKHNEKLANANWPEPGRDRVLNTSKSSSRIILLLPNCADGGALGFQLTAEGVAFVFQLAVEGAALGFQLAAELE